MVNPYNNQASTRLLNTNYACSANSAGSAETASTVTKAPTVTLGAQSTGYNVTYRAKAPKEKNTSSAATPGITMDPSKGTCKMGDDNQIHYYNKQGVETDSNGKPLPTVDPGSTVAPDAIPSSQPSNAPLVPPEAPKTPCPKGMNSKYWDGTVGEENPNYRWFDTENGNPRGTMQVIGTAYGITIIYECENGANYGDYHMTNQDGLGFGNCQTIEDVVSVISHPTDWKLAYATTKSGSREPMLYYLNNNDCREHTGGAPEKGKKSGRARININGLIFTYDYSKQKWI